MSKGWGHGDLPVCVHIGVLFQERRLTVQAFWSLVLFTGQLSMVGR